MGGLALRTMALDQASELEGILTILQEEDDAGRDRQLPEDPDGLDLQDEDSAADR